MCALPRLRESGAFSIEAADGSRGSENAETPHGRQLLAASGIMRSAVAARASASRSAANRVVMAASIFLLAPAATASEYSVTLPLEGRPLPLGHVVGILHCRATALPRVLLRLAQSDVERAAAGARREFWVMRRAWTKRPRCVAGSAPMQRGEYHERRRPPPVPS